MRFITYRTLAVGCLGLLSVLARADTVESIETELLNPERAFGYILGDTLEQTVSLHNGDTVYALASMPAEQREGRWLRRRDVALSDDGKLLTMQYQIINAPLDVRVIKLPEILLQTNENMAISVPAWEFTMAPLIPDSDEALPQVPLMQADSLPQAPSSVAPKRNIRTLIAALAASLLAWLLWWLWRNWREAHSLPFAMAYRKVRRATANTLQQGNNDSWLALHQAFNHSAGRSIANGSVPDMLEKSSWLKPLESDIQTFFELSSGRFFATTMPQQTFDLKAFAKRLYRAEKQHNSHQNRPTLSSDQAP